MNKKNRTECFLLKSHCCGNDRDFSSDFYPFSKNRIAG